MVNEVHELSKKIRKNNPSTMITISEIISREDNHTLQRKVSDINNFLESLIKSQKSMVYLLVIITLTIKGFNAYGLHLNRIRSSLFAKYKKFLTTQEINPDYNSVCPVIITSWEI